MDWQAIERTGRELRTLGHRRRELVQRIRSELEAGNREEAETAAAELAGVSMQCMELLSRQHGFFEAEFTDRGWHVRGLPTGPDQYAQGPT